MKTIKIITILLILSVALCVNAKKKPEYHRAEIKSELQLSLSCLAS